MKRDKAKEYSILGALFCFGVIYNAFVKWLEDRGYHEGYVSYLVVVGSAVTILAAMPIVGVQAALKILKCFCASGTPMVLGSCHRHLVKEAKISMEIGRLLGGMDGYKTENRGDELEAGGRAGKTG